WNAATTAGLRRMRSAKPFAVGTAARAPIGLRSPTTAPPADETAARICAGGVPATKRTTVMPNGFEAEAELANASAPKITARRRLGRFTVQFVSARGPESSITRSGNGKGHLAAAL